VNSSILNALQTDLLHLVHDNSVPEDQLHAFLSWYSSATPETRPQRMPTDNHDVRLATRRDDDVDDGDNNNSSEHRKTLANNTRPLPMTSEQSVTPNRWFLHGGALSPRPTTTHNDVNSGSVSDGDGDGDGDYQDSARDRWTDERPGSHDYMDHATTRRHRYDSWYERIEARVNDDVTAHLSQVEQHDDDAAEHINITTHNDQNDDENDERQARCEHRRTTSPEDHRRSSVTCTSLCHHSHVHQAHADTSARLDGTPSHYDTDLVTEPPRRSYSLSPMSSPRPPPPPFNVASEFRPPTTAGPPLPPGPLSHELVRHLREQQVLRLAAVSRALHHQLRYLHHGSNGATSPSSAAAGMYAPSHRQFDAGLLLGAGAASSYTLHDSIMPGFRAADLALASGRDSPGDSDISNDNASGMLYSLIRKILENTLE